MTEWITLTEASRILGRSADTIRDWEQQGRLHASRTKGGHRRFAAADVHRLAATLGRAESAPSLSKQAPARPPASMPDWGPEGDHADDGLRDAQRELEFMKIRERVARIADTRRALEERNKAEQLQRETDRGQRAAAEARRRAERERIRNLKAFGHHLALWAGLGPEGRASVVEELERQVTPQRYPLDLPLHEAREFIRAKVDEVIRLHREEVGRAEAERRANSEREDEADRRSSELQMNQSLARALIEQGLRRATARTALWDARDREDLLHELRGLLQSRVDTQWSSQRVRRLVEQVISDWEEEAGDEAE